MGLTRIMYIEYKGDARIGRVKFYKTGKSIHYDGKLFLRLHGSGFKSNYFDEDVREEYWKEIRELSHLKNTKVING